MQIVVTVSELIEMIVVAIAVLGIVISILIYFILGWFNKHFRQNCYKCKNWKLTDVASFGNRCCYTCEKQNKAFAQDMNDKERYVKCADYQEVTTNES